jgi:hypothetical protein
MKNLVLLVVFLTTALFSSAQLVVKEAAKDTVVWQASKMTTVPKIVKFTLQEEDNYTIYYRNAKYTSITDIDYISIGDKETAIQLFELCSTVLLEDKQYNVSLDRTDYSISKSMGSVMIWSSVSYFFLSKKQIDSILETLKAQ